MIRVIHALFNIGHIEELARRDNWINRVHPTVKIIVTMIYILLVAGISKYGLSYAIIVGVYPLLLIIIGDIPIKELGQKMIIPILMGASLGLLNPYFDKQVIVLSKGFIISAGWISLLTMFLKSLWSISAAMVLVSTTAIEDIAYGLNSMRMPKIMTVQLLLMFRYITILVGEIERVLTAYSMRAQKSNGLDYPVWGSLIGQFFLRTSDRSVKLFEAMKLRGFDGTFKSRYKQLHFFDGVYLSFWLFLFGVFIGIRG